MLITPMTQTLHPCSEAETQNELTSWIQHQQDLLHWLVWWDRQHAGVHLSVHGRRPQGPWCTVQCPCAVCSTNLLWLEIKTNSTVVLQRERWTIVILHITIDTQSINSNSSCLPFLFSLLATNRINLRTKQYTKCLLVPVYGILYTVWYVNLFDSVVSSEKDMATKTHYYDAFREWW